MSHERCRGSAAASFFVRVLELLGHEIAGRVVLDLGSGSGGLVQGLVDHGANAYGCDFPEEVVDSDRLRPIEEPYRLPYDNDTFDLAVSYQVFEHVQDYGATLRELGRVVRPGGVSLHTFPSRYTFTEVHSLVPLASMIQSKWWLRAWASLGIRNEFQHGKSAAEVAEINHCFLRDQTTYYGRRELMRAVRAVCPDARLLGAEPLLASHNPRAQRLGRLARSLPAIGYAYSEVRSRTLYLRHQ